jgi:hypothetical protein
VAHELMRVDHAEMEYAGPTLGTVEVFVDEGHKQSRISGNDARAATKGTVSAAVAIFGDFGEGKKLRLALDAGDRSRRKAVAASGRGARGD